MDRPSRAIPRPSSDAGRSAPGDQPIVPTAPTSSSSGSTYPRGYRAGSAGSLIVGRGSSDRWRPPSTWLNRCCSCASEALRARQTSFRAWYDHLTHQLDLAGVRLDDVGAPDSVHLPASQGWPDATGEGIERGRWDPSGRDLTRELTSEDQMNAPRGAFIHVDC